MNEYAELFKDVTGKEFSKHVVDYMSAEPIDENISEAVSRLFYENREAFYHLKQKVEAMIKGKKKEALLLSTAGYFNYVDCDFKTAIKCFQEAAKLNAKDLETWFSLAFCYRQNGEEQKFNSIILHYDKIIKDFMKGKKTIEEVIRCSR